MSFGTIYEIFAKTTGQMTFFNIKYRKFLYQ